MRWFDVRVCLIGSASSSVDVLGTVSVGFCVECQCWLLGFDVSFEWCSVDADMETKTKM